MKPTKYYICSDCATLAEKTALGELNRLDAFILDRRCEIKRIKKLKWNMPTRMLAGIIIGSIGVVIVYGYDNLMTVLGTFLAIGGLILGFVGWIEKLPNSLVNMDLIDVHNNSIRDMFDKKREIINQYWRKNNV